MLNDSKRDLIGEGCEVLTATSAVCPDVDTSHLTNSLPPNIYQRPCTDDSAAALNLIAEHESSGNVTNRSTELAYSIKQALLCAESDAATVHFSMSIVEGETTAMEAYCSRAQALNVTAENAKMNALLKFEAVEQNRKASLERIQAADEELRELRQSVDASISAIESQESQIDASWESRMESSPSKRAAQCLRLAQRRASLLSQLSAAEAHRQQLLEENERMVGADTEAAKAAQQHTLAACVAATRSVELKQQAQSTERVKATTASAQEAAEKVRQASLRAAEAKVEIRRLVGLVLHDGESEAQTSAEREIALCSNDQQLCAEAVQQVDTCAERIFHLQEVTQRNLRSIVARCSQALAARTQGDTGVMRTVRASKDVIRETARARTSSSTEESVLTVVRSLTSSTSSDSAFSQSGEELYIIPEMKIPEADLSRSPDKTRAARAAAATLRAQRDATRAKYTELLAVAQHAQQTVEERVLAVEAVDDVEIPLSEMETGASLVEDSVRKVENKAIPFDNYHKRAEEFCLAAENARLSATIEANALVEQLLVLKECIDAADNALQAEQVLCETSLSTIDSTESLSRQEETVVDYVSEIQQESQRVELARQRVEILTRLYTAEREREKTAAEEAQLARSYIESFQATTPVLVASSVAQSALALQQEATSMEKLMNSFRANCEAVERVRSIAQHCAQIQTNVHGAVQSVHTALLSAAHAATAVKTAAAQCEAMAMEQPAFVELESSAVEHRCAEALQRVDASCEQVNLLRERCELQAQQAVARYGQAVAARVLGDLAVAQATDSSEEAAREALRTEATGQEMLSFANAAVDRCCKMLALSRQNLETAQVSFCGAESAHAAMKRHVANQLAAQQNAETLIAAADAANNHADRTAADAKSVSLRLNETLLSAETDAATAKCAGAVAEEEARLLEAYCARAEELGSTADEGKRGALREANESGDMFIASDLRLCDADQALLVVRTCAAQSLERLNDRHCAEDNLLQQETSSVTMLSLRRADFAQERADVLGALSEAEDDRKKTALEHVSLVQAHSQSFHALNHATTAFTAASDALELQNNTHSSSWVEYAARSSQEAAERVDHTAQRAEAAKAEVRAAVETATVAAAESEQATAAATAAVAEYRKFGCVLPEMSGMQLNLSDETPRDARCAQAIQRVDASADGAFSLQKSAQQESEQAAARCSHGVEARNAGDRAVERAMHDSHVAVREATCASISHRNTLFLADAALMRSHEGARTSSAAWEESCVAVVDAQLAVEVAEAQQSEFVKMYALSAAARAAEEELESSTIAVDKIALCIEDAVRLAEEAAVNANEAHASVECELCTFTEYRSYAEDSCAKVQNAMVAISEDTRRCEEEYRTLLLQIQTSDDALVAEHASIEEQQRLLVEPVLLDDSEAALRVWTAERAIIAEKIVVLMHNMHQAACRREKLAREHIDQVHSRPHASTMKECITDAPEITAAATQKKELLSEECVNQAAQLARNSLDKVNATLRHAVEAQDAMRGALEHATVAAEAFNTAASALETEIKACEERGVVCPQCKHNSTEILRNHTQRREDAAHRVINRIEKISTLHDQVQQVVQETTTACEDALVIKKDRDAQVLRCIESSAQVNALATEATQTEAKMIASAEAALVRASKYVNTSRQALEESRTAAAEAESARVAAEAIVPTTPSHNHQQDMHQPPTLLHQQFNSPQHSVSKASTTSPPMYTSTELTNTLTMRQAALERFDALCSTVRSAGASAAEWTQTVEQVAFSLHQTVQSAEFAVDAARQAVRTVDGEHTSTKKFFSRVKQLSGRVDDAVRDTIQEMNACEEVKRALVKRIKIADNVLEDERASVEEELYLLDQTFAAGNGARSEAVKRAHNGERSELVSRVHAALTRRENQAIEHATTARASAKSKVAQEHADRAASFATEVVCQQQPDENWSGRLVHAAESSAQAVERVNAVVAQSIDSNFRAHMAVEEVHKACEAVMPIVNDIRFWKSECEKLGLDCSRNELQEWNNMMWYQQRCRDAAHRVEESANHIMMLQDLTQNCVVQVEARSQQINSIRSEAESTVSRVLDAVREASEAAEQVRQIESEMMELVEAVLMRLRVEAVESAHANGEEEKQENGFSYVKSTALVGDLAKEPVNTTARA